MGPQGTRAAVQYLLTLQQTDDQLLLTLSVQSSIVATTIVAIIVVTIVAATTIVCYVLRPALRESNEHRTWLLQELMNEFENQEIPCQAWAEDVHHRRHHRRRHRCRHHHRLLRFTPSSAT